MVALALPLLAAASGLIAFSASERPQPTARADRARVGLVVAAAVTAAALLASFSGAGGAAQGQAPSPPGGQSGALQNRLFSASTNSRLDYWRVAAKQYAAHPILGSGAGTFELYWNRERPAPVGSRFAHNLYLQVLAELGPIALILLAVAFAAPFAALRSARRLPVVPAVAGAYAAVLAHAALDWDWQLPVVTVIGLCAGAAILVGARAPYPHSRSRSGCDRPALPRRRHCRGRRGRVARQPFAGACHRRVRAGRLSSSRRAGGRGPALAALGERAVDRARACGDRPRRHRCRAEELLARGGGGPRGLAGVVRPRPRQQGSRARHRNSTGATSEPAEP